jgi:UDP:flavonoid glycosyltransferase YjiC (YdhE family)
LSDYYFLRAGRTMSRVIIVTYGTRGDLDPYVALARHMMSLGWQTAIATSPSFKDAVLECGAEFFPLKLEVATFMNVPENRVALWGGKMLDQVKMMRESTKDFPDNYRLAYKATQQFKPHVILATILTLSECLAIGQVLMIPVITAATVPIATSGEYAPVTMAATPFRFATANLVAHKAVAKAALIFSKMIAEFREEIGAPPAESFAFDIAPVINMFSPLVFPPPKDWPEHIHTVGYFVNPVPADYTPEPALAAFLADGPAPVYIGFGSMPVPDMAAFAREVVGAARELGARMILCGGWNELQGFAFPPDVLFIRGAPHEWLLPQCSAAVHHGGAGTTAARYDPWSVLLVG